MFSLIVQFFALVNIDFWVFNSSCKCAELAILKLFQLFHFPFAHSSRGLLGASLPNETQDRQADAASDAGGG